MTGLAEFDYTRITPPGAVLAVRLPGIYADVANTESGIIETNLSNGQITLTSGFAAAGGNTSHSRTLALKEKVYVTQILVKRDAALIELLTVDVTTLGDGRGTRYRSELNVKMPGLETMTPEDMKKTIDTVITDPATASTVESKTIKLGMSPNEDKRSLGNPDKIIDLGAKQVYIYKDMKWCSSTTRCRMFSSFASRLNYSSSVAAAMWETSVLPASSKGLREAWDSFAVPCFA
jgi:hypothetical protein